MTARYQGMNRNTGLGISDTEHISQSMRDILLTPVGSRVMRREYGSLLFGYPEVGAAHQAYRHQL